MTYANRLFPKLMPTLGAMVALFAAAPPARAAVSLALSDGDSTPTSRTVIPGSTFTITASLISTSEPVTGVDYYLQTSGAASGKLAIFDRNVGTSPFSDLIKADTGDNGANPGVEDASVRLLSPRNGLDLGASIANVSSPLGAGTYALASYTINVPGTLVPGTYTISTTSDPGTGWVGGAPLFNEASFSQQGTFTITVNAPTTPVPEPAMGGLVAAAGLLLTRRRCR
jgi:hypothetical protein